MQASQQNIKNPKPFMIKNRRSTNNIRIWLVVADYKIARIFSLEGNSLTRIHEIRPDKGERFSIFLFRASTHVRRRGDIHFIDKSASLLIAKIVSCLSIEAHNDEYDRLIIVASPGMLESLRRNMPRSLLTRIKADAARDMTSIDDERLYSELQKIVRI